MGEYIPQAPVNDEAKKANGNLPGLGGVYNVVNFHLYHYAGNNPVKYTDPDGRNTAETIRNTFTGMGSAGVFLPEPTTTAIGLVLLAVVGIDAMTNNSLSNAVGNFIDSPGFASKPVRDKEGNPVPPGNQSPGPLGKGANAGPENIGDPGDLGGPNFKPPKKSVFAIIGTFIAGLAQQCDNQNERNKSMKEIQDKQKDAPRDKTQPLNMFSADKGALDENK